MLHLIMIMGIQIKIMKPHFMPVRSAKIKEPDRTTLVKLWGMRTHTFLKGI